MTYEIASPPTIARRCECGTELAPNFLVCPICQRLVHATRLGALAREASAFEAANDLRNSLSLLRQALQLLPTSTRQHAVLSERATRLSDAIDRGEGVDQDAGAALTQTSATATPAWAENAKSTNPLFKVGATAGGLGLIAWKFKFVLVFIATKGKLLLLGLGKSSTLLSMFLSLGVYWTIWGWKFALGFVLSIYVHEMGHVAALRRFGIPASAPMFIPGLGAYVRLGTYPQTAREDARVGLAGPIFGLGCAIAVAVAYAATGIPLLAAIAKVGAWINLFNLVPIWQLDGSRGFRALSKSGRWAISAIAAGCGFYFDEGLYYAIAAVGAFRALSGEAPSETDQRTILEFTVLLLALGLVYALEVPTP